MPPFFNQKRLRKLHRFPCRQVRPEKPSPKSSKKNPQKERSFCVQIGVLLGTRWFCALYILSPKLSQTRSSYDASSTSYSGFFRPTPWLSPGRSTRSVACCIEPVNFGQAPPCIFHCFVRKMPIEDIHLALAPNPRVLLGSCAPSSAVSVAGGSDIADVALGRVLVG